MSAIQEIAAVLAESPMCFIATAEGAQPRVRAFQYQFVQDNKLWFCTAKSKKVYRQLQDNPAVEIGAVTPDMNWVRVSGNVTLEDNRAVKERILSEQPFIRQIYQSADNPDFTTFCLEHGEYELDGFSGNPPRTGTF